VTCQERRQPPGSLGTVRGVGSLGTVRGVGTSQEQHQCCSLLDLGREAARKRGRPAVLDLTQPGWSLLTQAAGGGVALRDSRGEDAES
jgi:hypothetical protein